MGGAPIGLVWVREEHVPVGAVTSCREWREGKGSRLGGCSTEHQE